MDLSPFIRDVPDFPRPGVLFRDITPLLASPSAFAHTLDQLVSDAAEHHPDVIVGIESRGFLFGGPIADRLQLPFVLVRKPGKLPAPRMSVEYTLEYGESQLDIHEDAVRAGQTAYIVDDLLATGGTALATAKLVEMIRGRVAGFGFVIELKGLGGRAQLTHYPVFSILRFP